MIIKYRLDEKEYSTSCSDLNVEIKESKVDDEEKVEVKALNDIELISAKLDVEYKFNKKDLIFANGYQSWTESKEFKNNEHLNDLSKLPKFLVENIFHLRAYGSQAFTSMKKQSLSAFDLAYINGDNYLFIANKNYNNAYLLIRFFRKKGKITLESDVFGKKLKKDESFIVFDYVYSNDKKSKDEYLNNLKPKSNRKLFGYSSWYNYYQNINEEKINKVLDNCDKRFDLFQIDDGYESYVGDWLNIDKNKFPNGLNKTVDKIHDKNMLAGIWLAPFIVEQKSELFNKHQEYLARDEKGQLISAGCNWSGSYVIDLNNPDAVNYVKECLRYYVELGFDFYKLDFLYTVNLKPLYGKTRAQTSAYAYSIINEVLHDKLVLGCGAIISSSFETFDYLRIGPDVSLKFDDVFYMKIAHPERISTKITICNSIFRSILNNHAFLNDPDVFLLRDDNISLNDNQKYALTKINSLFGSLLLTSDDTTGYDERKKKILDDALNNFRNASDVKYKRDKNIIDITYKLNDENHSFKYNMKKGLIFDEK